MARALLLGGVGLRTKTKSGIQALDAGEQKAVSRHVRCFHLHGLDGTNDTCGYILKAALVAKVGPAPGVDDLRLHPPLSRSLLQKWYDVLPTLTASQSVPRRVVWVPLRFHDWSVAFRSLYKVVWTGNSAVALLLEARVVPASPNCYLFFPQFMGLLAWCRWGPWPLPLWRRRGAAVL